MGGPMSSSSLSSSSIEIGNGVSTDSTVCLAPEYKKTALSMMYLAGTTFTVCFASAVAHQRSPDRTANPPLPDVIFYFIPFTQWGVMAAEVCAIILMISLIITGGVFHKHRSILTRRFCTILGTIYMIRIVTIVSTSLPITSPLQECSPKEFDTVWKKLELAATIWSKSGFRLYGVKVCGDYMFSGHVTTLTTSNLFMQEYSPHRFAILRYASYSLNILGMIFLVAGRGHYTVDVVVAFVVAFLIFSYYHTLVSLRLAKGGGNGIKYFPLLSYFERNVLVSVPNVYEFPTLSSLMNGTKRT